MASQVAAVIALYYASAEDLEAVCCSLDFHETKDSPMRTQNPETERRVFGHVAQSESENKPSFKADEDP